ncbi:hypothetical protein [Wielerella bovis]|uniref:hypothetical protein n=1 Tax=Wielerella bovis TaxID=2917790 RepID=UPI002018A164|nr:hypothetical protein [Wielerella bovis]ULJ63950.1 hypothetical protein MIS33_07190 [Wielerella bovis]ULJ68069.1 hypothetical protein MIS31_05945 [Wielerella bovis]
MKIKQWIKRIFIIALLAGVIAAPFAWLMAHSPFNDIREYEMWGLCDGLKTAAECDDYVTPSVVFWHLWLHFFLLTIFIGLLLLYLLGKILIFIYFKITKSI